MKEVKVVSCKEVGFNYDVCNELYEDGCDKSIEGRYLDVEFLNLMFVDRLEWDESVEKKEVISKMVSNISKLDGEVDIDMESVRLAVYENLRDLLRDEMSDVAY